MKQKVAQILGILVLLATWSFASNPPSTRLLGLVNYPNPFHSAQTTTTIAYRLTDAAAVTVHIYDEAGDLVRQWNFNAGDSGARAGFNTLRWDGSTEGGKTLPAGSYICRVVVDEETGRSESFRKIGIIR